MKNKIIMLLFVLLFMNIVIVTSQEQLLYKCIGDEQFTILCNIDASNVQNEITSQQALVVNNVISTNDSQTKSYMPIILGIAILVIFIGGTVFYIKRKRK